MIIAHEIRSGRRLESDGDLLGPCPFRAGPIPGQAAVAKAAFYATLGSASMGNREGPARTARMRVEIRQNWARQSAGLEGSAPSPLSPQHSRRDSGISQPRVLFHARAHPYKDALRRRIQSDHSARATIACQGRFVSRFHEGAVSVHRERTLRYGGTLCPRTTVRENFAEAEK